MRTLLLAFAATFAFAQAVQLPTAASANSEVLLRQLLGEKELAPKAVVDLSAAIRVVGTIRHVSAMKLPLTCSVSFGYYDGRSRQERKTRRVTFKGDTGTCDVTVPFAWENVDPAYGEIELYVIVSNTDAEDQFDTVSLLAAPADASIRSSAIAFPSVAVPGQGETKKLTFSIRM